MRGLSEAVYDGRACQLGDGMFWHPERQTLFWFDIPAQKLLWRGAGESGALDLPERASAAGWQGAGSCSAQPAA